MKLVNSLFLLLALSFASCSTQQGGDGKSQLSPLEFSDKLKELSAAPLLDVRTPEEFLKGHIANAKNIDWNGDEFDKQIAELDKSKPVLVYCLSGGRSSAAASKMREDGFKQVLELDGGMMKWRAAQLPETTSEASNESTSTGMSQTQFDALLDTDKLVLIDFYAEWCAPCKRMKPYLDEISKDMADKVTVVRIDVDANAAISQSLKIESLPTLQLYKNKALVWSNVGYIDKQKIVEQIH